MGSVAQERQPGQRTPAPATRLVDEPGALVWTIPNAISALRLLLVPVFAVLIFSGADGWALTVLAVSGITDWLDGYLARRLRQVSRLGQLLDPAADRLFILVTLVGLVWRAVVPIWLVVILLAREAMLAVLLPILARHGYGPLAVSFVGKMGTFALLYAFPLLLLAQHDGALGQAASIAGWAFTWWGVGLYWLAGVHYVRQTRGLVLADAPGRPTPAAS
jgi:cardiolipin synthase